MLSGGEGIKLSARASARLASDTLFDGLVNLPAVCSCGLSTSLAAGFFLTFFPPLVGTSEIDKKNVEGEGKVTSPIGFFPFLAKFSTIASLYVVIHMKI